MEAPFFDAEVESALAVLRRGGMILYPTDTVWGLGCDATHAPAIDAIFRLKQREDSKSMIILVASERDILQYVAAPDPAVFDFLAEQERPTTIIFDDALGLPPALVAPDGSIAIRMTRDPFCRHLIRRLGRPIVSTSANTSGQPAPAHFASVEARIREGVDHVVQWRQDDIAIQPPSRIIRWQGGGDYTVIRP